MTKGLWEERRRLLKDVRGDILEIGPGVGENIKYLSPRVRSYFAIDPSSGFIKIGHIESQQMNKKFSIKVMRMQT